MVGDEVAEFTVDPGIVIGIAMGNRELPFLLMGDPRVPCVSLKCDKDGETARRFEAEGYGSKRSSTFSKSVRRIRETFAMTLTFSFVRPHSRSGTRRWRTPPVRQRR
jgi:hypothetical protein